MSIFAAVYIRPLQRQCLHRATTGLLSVHIASPSSSLRLRAVIPLPPNWHRYQSTTSRHDASNTPPPRQSQQKQPKMTLRKLAGRAIVAGLRNVGYALSLRGMRQSFRQYPFSTCLAFVMLSALAILTYVGARIFYRKFYNSYFSKYPEPVANTLRQAIYYSDFKPDPERALKYYKKAMQQCTEVGLDPFSDEVLGIRIRVSAWLQKIDKYASSAEVLESILKDCLAWITAMEKCVQNNQVDKNGYYVDLPRAPDTKDSREGSDDETAKADAQAKDRQPETPRETLWRKRERLLAKAVQTSVALGELYADEHVLEPKRATERIVWAVETTLKELHRRRTEEKKPGEHAWLAPAEIGGAMESLGRDYERNSKFHLAIPLFFQALRLCESPCHRAVIMNNLAAAFTQIPAWCLSGRLAEGLLDPAVVSSGGGKIPKTRPECLAAAENWARNALTHGSDVAGEERTPECDEACAVALCNWGDVAAMMGRPGLAKKKYEQCVEMSGRLGFADGVAHARDGLARLSEGK